MTTPLLRCLQSLLAILSLPLLAACHAQESPRSVTSDVVPNFDFNELIQAQADQFTTSEAWAQSDDVQRMKAHRWIVRTVTRDGETLPAQIGQKPGDVIEIKLDEDRLDMG